MKQLTSALKKIGVTDIFFCAGARNKELHPLFDPFSIHYNYDERSASFKALGLSKITNKPVVICTTSGSAVLECLPAIAEAYYTNTKLILITADRSPAHHGTGFAQTFNQLDPVKTLCRNQIEIYSDEEFNSAIELFPLHLNIFTERENKARLFSPTPQVTKPTLLLFSGGAKELGGDKLYSHFSESTMHYLEPDCDIERTPTPFEVLSDERLCQILKLGEIEQVIRIGRSPISKVWRNLNDGLYPRISVFHLDPDDLLRLTFGPVVSFDTLMNCTFPRAKKTKQNIPQLQLLLEKYPNSELSNLKTYSDTISAHDLIFLGNSLAIRNWKTISSRVHSIYSNRGINGIDGAISSAIGLALGTERNVHCIIGDLTFLYDLGSIIEELPYNLTIVVMNNEGGRIFEVIDPPFPQIVCKHKYNMKELTSGFRLPKGQLIELFPENIQTESFRVKWRELHD